MATKPFKIRHYDLDSFALYVNGKHPERGLITRNGSRENARHGIQNAVWRIGHSSLERGSSNNPRHVHILLLFDLTPDLSASGHTSHMDSGNIRLELKFSKALPDSITCLLYLEYNSIRTNFPKRLYRLLKMDTVQILSTLQNVKSLLGVFPSDLLPHSIARSGTVIINADPYRERFTLASNPFRTQGF